MSVQQLITDHLDLWTAAHKTRSSAGRGSSNKLDLVGIKKLRELILELAVRGKLVPQDPNDEPASELLNKISTEKAKLIKEGKIKPDKPLGEVDSQELQFEIPRGWEAVRFGQVTFNRDFERIPLSVDERSHRKGPFDYYGASGVIDNIDAFLFDKPLMLIGEDGANLLSRSSPIAFMAYGKYWVNNHAHVLDGISESFLLYLCLYINSISLAPYVTGTAQPKMNQAKMNSIIVVLPPEREQHRIVAKVDELMAFCDQLEQSQTDNIAAHEQLVEALLATLTNSQNSEDLQANWQRLATHFDTLFTTEHSIDQLKQTILQLAVMGKLVPQNPNDEPASLLLKKIAKEKEQLIKEGKIKKQKPLPKITEEERSFELPEGWEWCRLGCLGTDIGGGTPSKANAEFWSGDIPWVSPKDMKSDHLFGAQDMITNAAIENSSAKLVPPNSLLLVVRGMILAHSFPVAINKVPVTINQDMKALLFSSIEPEFLLVLMKGFKNQFLDLIDRSSHGTCKLVSEKLWNFAICIPPLAEQHRIVAKVDELMTLCDTLKANLQNAQTTQLALAECLVDQAVG